MHVTDIIHELEKIIHPGRYKREFTEEQLDQFAVVGFFWERVLGGIWRDTEIRRSDGRLIRPPEQYLDGVYLSPDALDVEDWVVEEFKATWISSNLDIASDPRVFKWRSQTKAYCRALDTRRCRLRALFVCGHWRPPVPVVKLYEIEYSKNELLENWLALLRLAKRKGWLTP